MEENQIIEQKELKKAGRGETKKISRVYFFMGFSVGAGVLIGQCFGAKNEESIHEAVETTIAVTLILCVVFTVIGYFGAAPMLRLINLMLRSLTA